MARARRALAFIGLAMVLVASACGGSSGGSDGGGDGGGTKVVVDGGSATIVSPTDAQKLDPNGVINSSSQGSTVMSAIYDALYTVDQETGDVQPRIATAFEGSDDCSTWTMTLRDDVMFSDGTPFDADAVLAEWTRAMGNIRSSGFSPLNFFVDTMSAPDATTFVVDLKVPHCYFAELAPWSNLVWIPSPTAVAAEGDNFTNAPVGAGPFVLDTRTQGSTTTLKKNPTYWQAGLPKLDTLVVQTVTDPQQATDTVTTGGAQAYANAPDPYAVQMEDTGSVTLVTIPQVGGVAYLFGSDRPPFDDIRARQAVYYAMDLQAIDDSQRQGAGTLTETFFPEGSPYYDPNSTFVGPNPEEAQRLLDELAAEGKPVSFTMIDAGGDSHNNAVAVQTQLSTYDNLTVNVEQLDGASYGTTLYGGDFDMAIYGMGGKTPDPVIQSMNTGWAIPIASMDSPEMDAVLKAEREATTVEDRKAALDDMTGILNDLFRLKWFYRNNVYFAESNDVSGAVLFGQGTPLLENFGRVG